MKTRFEERKEDLCKACFRLRDAVSQPKNDFTRDSAIKRFEFCYEFAWKAIKLYLETKDIDVRNPKDSFKEALVQGLEPVLKPTAPRFSINFGSFFGKIFCSMLNTAAKFCQKVAQNLWKIETRWVLRQALVDDGDAWSKVHSYRNLTSHTYDEDLANEVYDFIAKFGLKLFEDLTAKLK